MCPDSRPAPSDGDGVSSQSGHGTQSRVYQRGDSAVCVCDCARSWRLCAELARVAPERGAAAGLGVFVLCSTPLLLTIECPSSHRLPSIQLSRSLVFASIRRLLVGGVNAWGPARICAHPLLSSRSVRVLDAGHQLYSAVLSVAGKPGQNVGQGAPRVRALPAHLLCCALLGECGGWGGGARRADPTEADLLAPCV